MFALYIDEGTGKDGTTRGAGDVAAPQPRAETKFKMFVYF